MRRIITLMLGLHLSLIAAGFWTLTGTEKLNIYVQNEISEIKPQTIVTIKKKMKAMLESHGVNTKGVDSGTMMIKLSSIKNGDDYYVYIKLAVGEEVMTHRKGDIETFALTYENSDFIESNALDSDVLESVDFLLSEYKEQFEEDQE